MTDEELVAEIGSAVEYHRGELAEQLAGLLKDRITKQMSEKNVVDLVERSGVISRLVREYFEKFVTNEIGNRLRCGIYDGLKMDKLFESVWTTQFDVAIRDRIRGQVYKAVDDVIAERLKSLK